VSLGSLILFLGDCSESQVFGLNIIYEEEVGLGSVIAGLSEKTLDILRVHSIIGLNTEVKLLMIDVDSSLEVLISSGSGAPFEVKVDACL
jgi:ACT domain-containing protein